MVAGHAFDTTQLNKLEIELKQAVALAGFTTMKVGGPAQYFASVSSVLQMIKLVRWAREVGLPYFILGGGSNILISDAGIRGLVIYNRCREVRIDEPALQCMKAPDERPYLFAESGAATAGAARFSVNEGVTGFEWAVSVPGTIGGAVVGNAGAHGGEVKDSLESALIIDQEGEVRQVELADFAYAYRDSNLKRLNPLQASFKPVVLSANFHLDRADKEQCKQKAEQFLAHRRRTQPVEPSLGSTFVNPPGDYAGRLIEAAGLKGRQVGGAKVSELHANFIINPGGVGSATASDVLQLMEIVQASVKERFGVVLEPEVQMAGEW